MTLSQKIADRALLYPMFIPWGVPSDSIKNQIRNLNLRGNAAQCVADRAMLYVVEAEMPESAARYYDRQKPYIPSSIDGQLADIRQGWRDDVKRIGGQQCPQ